MSLDTIDDVAVLEAVAEADKRVAATKEEITNRQQESDGLVQQIAAKTAEINRYEDLDELNQHDLLSLENTKRSKLRLEKELERCQADLAALNRRLIEEEREAGRVHLKHAERKRHANTMELLRFVEDFEAAFAARLNEHEAVIAECRRASAAAGLAGGPNTLNHSAFQTPFSEKSLMFLRNEPLNGPTHRLGEVLASVRATLREFHGRI